MKIATIEIISDAKIHPNADTLDLATVNGWQVCVKRNEFKAGDKCIYVCIDTIFDDLPQYEFLRNKNFRIKTIRLRGEVSQGIVFPISLLNEFDPTIKTDELEIGSEVSETIHCKHWEKPISAQLAGEAKGSRPSWVRRTDEENIQSRLKFLDELYGEPYYIAVKLDGCVEATTLIQTEHGNKTIKEICDSKYQGKVVSFDVETQQVKYSAITNHFINDPCDNWYEIETESGKILKITGNHRVWLPELHCYRKVEDLNENDKFLLKE